MFIEDALQQTIEENYHRILSRIEQAARGVGRDPQSIRLVVVTKMHLVDRILAVIRAGAKYLGENYAEEAIPKIQALYKQANVEWHMIGHVQSRKAPLIGQYFHYVHSLDSLHLAEKLNRTLAERHRKLPVLLQFNVSGEASKSGWEAWNEQQVERLLPDISKILDLPYLEVHGLMTMPPLFTDPELARPYFIRLRELRDYLQHTFTGADFCELSMGMSGDFEVAIQEGATLVRIGQAILGPRTGQENQVRV